MMNPHLPRTTNTCQDMPNCGGVSWLPARIVMTCKGCGTRLILTDQKVLRIWLWCSACTQTGPCVTGLISRPEIHSSNSLEPMSSRPCAFALYHHPIIGAAHRDHRLLPLVGVHQPSPSRLDRSCSLVQERCS